MGARLTTSLLHPIPRKRLNVYWGRRQRRSALVFAPSLGKQRRVEGVEPGLRSRALGRNPQMRGNRHRAQDSGFRPPHLERERPIRGAVRCSRPMGRRRGAARSQGYKCAGRRKVKVVRPQPRRPGALPWGRSARGSRRPGCSGRASSGPGRRGRPAAARGPRRPPRPSRSPPSSSRTSCGTGQSGAAAPRAARSPRAGRTRGETLSRGPSAEAAAPGLRRTLRALGPAPRPRRPRRRRRPSQVRRPGCGGRLRGVGPREGRAGLQAEPAGGRARRGPSGAPAAGMRCPGRQHRDLLRPPAGRASETRPELQRQGGTRPAPRALRAPGSKAGAPSTPAARAPGHRATQTGASPA